MTSTPLPTSTSPTSTPTPSSEPCNSITCAGQTGETFYLFAFVAVVLTLTGAAGLRAMYGRRRLQSGAQVIAPSLLYSANAARILLQDKPKFYDAYIHIDDPNDGASEEKPRTWDHLMPVAAAFGPFDDAPTTASKNTTASGPRQIRDPDTTTTRDSPPLQQSVILPGAGAGSALAMIVFARERRDRARANSASIPSTNSNPNTTAYRRTPPATMREAAPNLNLNLSPRLPGALSSEEQAAKPAASPDSANPSRARVVFIVEMPLLSPPASTEQRPRTSESVVLNQEEELLLPPLELGIAEVDVHVHVPGAPSEPTAGTDNP